MRRACLLAIATTAVAMPPSEPPGTTEPPSTTTSTSTTTTTTTTTTLPIPAEAWAVFDDAIRDRLLGGSNRAVGVAVSVGGEIVHEASFGTRAPDAPDPLVPTDRFRIASISKVITATVVLQLVADGSIGLDEPVGGMLALLTATPITDPAMSSITVRQLLSHTSGIPKYREQFFGGTFTSCPQAAAYGIARPLARTPGTRHDYSNLNYCLLTILIEHLTGLDYEDAVTERLLQPLGITGMRLAGTNDSRPGEVVHVSGAGRTYMEALAGAGSWVAAPADVVRILDSLDTSVAGWHPLPPGLATLMRIPLAGVTYPEPHERTYGLGIVSWPNGSWGHTGTVENTRTMLCHRTDGVTWTILVSGSRPDQTEQLADVFDRAVGSAGITFAAVPPPDSPE